MIDWLGYQFWIFNNKSNKFVYNAGEGLQRLSSAAKKTHSYLICVEKMFFVYFNQRGLKVVGLKMKLEPNVFIDIVWTLK